MKVCITIPSSGVSTNVYYRRAGFRMHISQAGIKFKKLVADIVAEYYPYKFGEARLKVSIYYHPATKRISDIDNRCKCAIDALASAGVFDNDAQIDSLHIYRCNVIKGGKLIIEVEDINDE
jgi:crossover junction endodeoxyribonuclease RusA